MTEEEKGMLIGNFFNSLPRSVNLKNLLGNEVFISWFLPRLKLIKDAQRWPQEKISELIEIRLKNLLNHLNSNAIFWREYFSKYYLDLQSLDIFTELSKLPVINKTDLIKWGNAMLIVNNDSLTTDYYTSGTTGVPLKVRIDDFDLIKNELVYVFEPDAFESERVGELLCRKFILLLGRKSTGMYVPYSEHFPLDAFSTISSKKTRQEIYNKIFNNSYIYLFAHSSVILELMKYVREDGVALPVIANLSGEGVSSEEEKFIYETTGVPIIFSYNCRESGKVGEKCPINIGTNRYHMYRERVLVEIIDDNGKQLKNDEEGNIVLTVLDRTAMPIIRYSTGDRGRILSKLCSCGRISPLLELQGRGKDIILLPDDNTFSVFLFRTLFVNEIGLENIARYQIIQKATDYVQINFIPQRKISLEKIKIVETILENILKNKVRISIQEVDNIESHHSGKNRVFVSLEEYKSVKLI